MNDYNSHDVVNTLLNKWRSISQGLPITISLAQLGILISEALNAAYEAGHKAGQQDASQQQEQNSNSN